VVVLFHSLRGEFLADQQDSCAKIFISSFPFDSTRMRLLKYAVRFLSKQPKLRNKVEGVRVVVLEVVADRTLGWIDDWTLS
jgi:hypothetical protein